ncbi:MAG: hypothetical protein IJ708_15025, partial [Clostridia bacterium]|nr:hypothetical protein [Clostridia bacterium]
MQQDHKQAWDLYLQYLQEERKHILSKRKKQAARKKMDTTDVQAAPSADHILCAIQEGKAEENPEITEEFFTLFPLLQQIIDGELPSNLRLNNLRRRAELIAQYDAADAFLNTIDVKAAFSSLMDQFLDHDEEVLAAYFTSSELCYYPFLAQGMAFQGQILSPSNMDGFLSMFRVPLLGTFLENIVFHRSTGTHLVYLFSDTYPVIKPCLSNHVKGRKNILQRICQENGSVISEYLHRLQERFPQKRILSLIGSRRRYAKMVTQYRRLLEVQAAVLKAIPEHYRDLYPKARAMERQFVLHIGPTNSGKTYDAITRLEEAGNGVYLAPLRLLAYEQFDTINKDGVPCNLLTGEEEMQVACAQVTASTIEMADLNRVYDVAVIDEGQMIADIERGGSWSAAILGLCAREIHICASPDAEQLLVSIIRSCGDQVEVVQHVRQTPLIVEHQRFRFPEDVKPGDALVVFSKKSVHAVAAELQSKKKGIRCSIIYGALPYEVRHEEARRFREGETDIVVATDAIGMGLNLPIQRVVFLEMEKFDGQTRRNLYDAEIKQIAGRAGRYGIYDEGFVAVTGGSMILEHAIQAPSEDLHSAVIAFPETLLGIDAPLTQILQRWNEVDDQEGWQKANLERLMFLAGLMEKSHTDKAFLYRFLTIPFDERNPELLEIWKEMYT